MPFTVVDGGLRLRVRLTPNSRHDGIEGIEPSATGSCLKVRVRAVPAEGAANVALAKLMAAWLRLPPSSVKLVAGAKSRLKTLIIAGQSRELAELISARLHQPQGGRGQGGAR
jgi:uncharacterized protein